MGTSSNRFLFNAKNINLASWLFVDLGYITCPEDCNHLGACGDDKCEMGESCAAQVKESCTYDCCKNETDPETRWLVNLFPPLTLSGFCGDGRCTETCDACPQDCSQCPECGNKVNFHRNFIENSLIMLEMWWTWDMWHLPTRLWDMSCRRDRELRNHRNWPQSRDRIRSGRTCSCDITSECHSCTVGVEKQN